MDQANAPHPKVNCLSVTECVGLEGEVRDALRVLDFVVRSAAISAQTGRAAADARVIGGALATVLLSIATDMAFVSAEATDEDALHARLHAVLDDCFSRSKSKSEALLRSEDVVSSDNAGRE